MDSAFAHAERAIAVAPHDPLGHAHISGLYAQQGDWPAAEAALQAAIALRPSDTGFTRRLSEYAARHRSVLGAAATRV